MKNVNENRDVKQHYHRHLITATVAANKGVDDTKQLIKYYGKNANRIDILRKLEKNSRFKLFWYIIFLTLGFICLVLDYHCWFNILDLVIVMVNIDLNSRGKLSGTVVGIIECFLYSFICLGSQLYGEIIKTMAICVPLNVYSIISWKIAEKRDKENKYKSSGDEIVIKKLSKKQKALYLLIFILVLGGCFVLLKYGLNQTTALILSSISLSGMIVMKILFARQYMDAWKVGLVVEFICIFMWLQTIFETGFSISGISMIVYYLACLSNDVFAYYMWKSMYRKVAVNGGIILAKRKVKIKRIIKLRRQYRNLHWDKVVDTTKNS